MVAWCDRIMSTYLAQGVGTLGGQSPTSRSDFHNIGSTFCTGWNSFLERMNPKYNEADILIVYRSDRNTWPSIVPDFLIAITRDKHKEIKRISFSMQTGPPSSSSNFHGNWDISQKFWDLSLYPACCWWSTHFKDGRVGYHHTCWHVRVCPFCE